MVAKRVSSLEMVSAARPSSKCSSVLLLFENCAGMACVHECLQTLKQYQMIW